MVAVPTMAALRAARDAAEDAAEHAAEDAAEEAAGHAAHHPARQASPSDRARAADLVELRLDTVDRPDVAAALHGRRGPVIVTCRAAWEGGHFAGAEEERLRLLREALDAGAEFVDIEWRTEGLARWLGSVARDEDRARVILSRHDFEGMPADLDDTVRDMRRVNAAGVVKVAGRARSLRDLRPLIAVGRAQAAGERTVLIGMGMAGVASRILPAHFGSCWTYAGPAVAPGQIDARRLRQEFRFDAVSARTQVYAVVGRPIAHSISPAMHNAAFEALGIDAVYIPCDAADLDDFLAFADALPIAGASVTAPFKLAAYERSQPMDDDARRVGAVNTLRRVAGAASPEKRGGERRRSLERQQRGESEPGGWESRNTDVAGFLAPLEARVALRGARAAILGTGGAARAVAIGLGAAGAAVTVHARNATAGAEVAALANGDVRDWSVAQDSWDLLINTTPIGTFPAVTETPYAGPFGAAGLRVVYDLVYNPRPTRLLREAAAAGCVTLDGLDMLVEQAALQFTWWTGRVAPVDVMRAAAERRLGEMAAEPSGQEALTVVPAGDALSGNRARAGG